MDNHSSLKFNHHSATAIQLITQLIYLVAHFNHLTSYLNHYINQFNHPKSQKVAHSTLIDCPNGFFGPGCRLSCQLCRNKAPCSSSGNACDCPAGWRGLLCAKPCAPVRDGRRTVWVSFRCFQELWVLRGG